MIYIPIGGNCAPTSFLSHKKLRNEAFPFDWHLSTLEQVYNVLESDFENFMDDFHFLDHNFDFKAKKTPA